MSAPRPVVVGMANPRSSDPRLALWPSPAGCTGARLYEVVRATYPISRARYVVILDRRNLCPQRWDPRRAGAAALEILSGLPLGAEVVVLGREAWRAFAAASRELTGDRAAAVSAKPPPPGAGLAAHGAVLYYLPHPSGRCRWYNDEENRRRAGELVAGLIRRWRGREGEILTDERGDAGGRG